MKHSYTSLSLFLKCPQRYKAQYIDRRIPRQTSEALTRGIAIHEKLEADLRAKAPTPSHWVDERMWQLMLTADAKAEVKVETPMMVAKIDALVVITKDYAVSLDHKTGRSDGDPLQFDIQAYLLNEVHGIEQVDGIFSYIDRRQTSKPYTPTKQSREAVVDLVHRAENETKWFAKPGFYCTGCPLTECRYAKPARRK